MAFRDENPTFSLLRLEPTQQPDTRSFLDGSMWYDVTGKQFKGIVNGAVGNIGGSFSRNIVDVTAPPFNAKFDGKACFGNVNTIVVTNGSNQVSCNAANFTQADVGKQFTASNGCCGVSANFQGQALFPQVAMHIGSVINSTTALIVKDSDGTPANATTSCSGATCIIAWGTNDDAALTAAEAVWASGNKCGSIQLPAGITAVLKGHFNNPGANCLGMEPQADFTAEIRGFGIGATVIGLFSGFNFASCTGGPGSDVCFIGYIEATAKDWQLNGFGIGNTAAGSAKKLLGPGLGAQLNQIACNAFGGSDTNVTGISFDGAGVRAWGLSIDGCGKTGGVINNGIAKLYYSFFGDTLGPNLSIGSTGDVTDFGSDYGTTGGTIVIQQAGRYHGIGSNLFNCATVANATALYMSNNANAVTILDGARFNCGSATSNGIFTNISSQKVVLTGGTHVGGTSSAILWTAGGTMFIDPSVVFDAGATSSFQPACAMTTGGGTGPACATLAGSTNEKGTVRMTPGTTPGATGTTTLTFAGTFSGATGAAPSCTLSYSNTGTGAWSLTTTTPILMTTRSTTAPVFNWNQTGALTAASTYDIDYVCVAK